MNDKEQQKLEKRRAKDREWTRSRRQAIKAYLDDLRNPAKCVLCTEHENCTLDFHHLDPSQKDITVSRTVANKWSTERLQTEVDKCVIICSNCHRKVHAGILALNQTIS